MPPFPAADRNLLFGIVALQMDFVRRDDLIAAMNAWVLAKAKPLGQVLREQGKLAEDEHALLEALVQKHLEKHGNDPEKSLAVVSSVGSVRHVLQQIADPDVQASLVHVAAARSAGDADATQDHIGGGTLPPQARFAILRPHARGGLGEVFVARDAELDREVALKEIQERHLHHPGAVSRFLLEAKVTGGLEHPGIVPVYGLGAYADGRPFYAMRFVKGDSLRNAIAAFHQAERQGQSASERSLALRQLLGRFVDVCNAIAYAHSRGVLHRDLKPGNIMLGKYGETLVVDWGLAKVLGQAEAETTEGVLVSSADSGLTQAGKALGTPAYMSPEQALGKLAELGPRSDVYSLGATLYCLLTGWAPFAEDDAGTVLGKVQRGAFPPPRQVRPGVPAALEAVCLKAMALRPEDRYATPRELAGEIEHWLADEPVTAYREPLKARLGRWVRKHQTLAAGAGALLLTGLAAVAVGGLLLGREQAKTLNEQQAKLAQQRRARDAQVNTLLDVAPQAVPAILKALEQHRDEIRPLLRQAVAKPEPQAVTAEASRLWRQHRARAALALLAEDPGQLQPLTTRLLEEGLDPAEMLLVRDALVPHGAALKESLWARAADTAKPDEQFRALVALAAFDPDGAGWKTQAATAVEQMVTENPLHLGTWVRGLQPVRGALQTSLAKVYREARSPERRALAARVLADYASDQPDTLADLLLDADPKQYAILLPTLKNYRARAVERMRREVQGEGHWNDPPLDPAWAQPPAELRRAVETADGLLAERWALCQTLPLERWPAVAEGLQACGYRPVRLRPFAQGGTVRLAAVWTRDGHPWKAETGLTMDAVKARDAAQKQDGLIPADVASYGSGDKVRHAALWVKPALKGEAARLYVDVPAAEHKAVTGGFRADGFIPWTLHGVPGGDGQARYAGVWWKADVLPKGSNVAWNDDEDALRGRVLLGEQLLIDVNISPAPAPAPTPPVAEFLRTALATADRNLAAKPKDLNRLFRRALARYNLRQNQAALADFDTLMAKAPTVAIGYHYRAVLHARLGHAAQARLDLAKLRKYSPDAALKSIVSALVGVYLGDEAAALKKLEEAVAAAPKDASLVYEAGCVHALAAEWVTAQQFGRVAALVGMPGPVGLVLLPVPPADRPGKLADRALALLRQAYEAGYASRDALDTDPDLERLRGRPDFVALKRHLAGPTAFASVWHGDTKREAVESHGLCVGAHLERCRELAAQGYRPAALSVALLDGKTVTASAWQRPYPRQPQRERVARRQATGAATLLKLAEPNDAWALFRHRPDPEARSQLVWRSQLLGVEAQQLAARLDGENDVSARRALILALGEYTEAQLPAAVRTPLTEKLLSWYRDDPDSGVHAAIDWLLRHGKEGPVPRPLDWQGAAKLKAIDEALKRRDPDGKRNWYVNRQGQTYVCIPGPAEFRMGPPLTETERRENETAHRRRIPRSFALASRSVTAEGFQLFLKERPDVARRDVKRYSPDADGPMVALTWYEAAQYCNWLSAKEGLPEKEWCYPKHAEIKDGMKPYPDYLKRKGYRLPTEAEWEYAARAGARSSRYFGSSVELLGRYAWYLQNAAATGGVEAESAEGAGSFARAWPVGQKRPNDLGLFDAHGNAWNWVYDPLFPYPKNQGTTAIIDIEDMRYIKELDSSRLLRGGAFDYRAEGVRLSFRYSYRPGNRSSMGGLRPARTLP